MFASQSNRVKKLKVAIMFGIQTFELKVFEHGLCMPIIFFYKLHSITPSNYFSNYYYHRVNIYTIFIQL